MPPVTPSQFRLGELTLTQLDSLARSAGTRTQALREAVAYWHWAVWIGGEQNAAEFSAEEWEILGGVKPPTKPEEAAGRVMGWGSLLAAELLEWWKGREILSHRREEYELTMKLARKVDRLNFVRGYALYSALRWLWGREGTPPEWYRPANWLGV